MVKNWRELLHQRNFDNISKLLIDCTNKVETGAHLADIEDKNNRKVFVLVQYTL